MVRYRNGMSSSDFWSASESEMVECGQMLLADGSCADDRGWCDGRPRHSQRGWRGGGTGVGHWARSPSARCRSPAECVLTTGGGRSPGPDVRDDENLEIVAPRLGSRVQCRRWRRQFRSSTTNRSTSQRRTAPVSRPSRSMAIDNDPGNQHESKVPAAVLFSEGRHPGVRSACRREYRAALYLACRSSWTPRVFLIRHRSWDFDLALCWRLFVPRQTFGDS